jgi:hypothetical protein
MGNVRWSRNSPFAPPLKGTAKVLHHHAPPLRGWKWSRWRELLHCATSNAPLLQGGAKVARPRPSSMLLK